MDFKLFTLVIDGIPSANIPIYPGNTIGELNSYLINLYPNTSLIININSFTKLNLDDTKNIFSQYWSQIDNPMFILNHKKKHGVIRIRNVERGVSYPSAKGFKNIPAWSRGASPWKELSPFSIGPIIFNQNVQAPIFENFWQSFKVWGRVEKQNTKNWKWPAEIHVDQNGEPNQNWHRWHNALLQHNLPVRRPNGKNVPLYAWWGTEKLGIIESRKKIYVPFLQYLYRSHPIYQKLLKEVKEGQNIIILEPDGPNHNLYPEGMEVTIDLLLKLQNVTKMKDFPGGEMFENPEKYVPYGHGYVLALTLLEDLK